MDDLERARKLLKSARDLFEMDDFAGVAGLTYQAIESAIIALTSKKNGKEYTDHVSRRKRAEEVLNLSKQTLRSLWSARNIDFYGNEKTGDEKKELTKEEIKAALTNAEDIIKNVEDNL